ncbi:hypothetical protein EV714DRAFT_284790 [Schizophyllum commune]
MPSSPSSMLPSLLCWRRSTMMIALMLLLALGARAAPAGVTLRADLHPVLLAFGPAAAVVLAREGEEEGLVGVPLVGRRRDAAMRGSDEPKGGEGKTEVRGLSLLWGKAVLIGVGCRERRKMLLNGGQQQDPSNGGDTPRDDDTPEDDLVQPKAHPSRRGIVGIVFLSLTLLLTLLLAAYPPTRRRTAIYVQKAATHVRVVTSRVHLPSSLRGAVSQIHVPAALSSLRATASHIHIPSTLSTLTHPSYHRIGEKVGSLFPAKPFGSITPKSFRGTGSKLSKTSESKLVRWAEEDMGLDAAEGHLALDDLESDHFLNEDVADEDLELADGEYIPLRAAKGRARVYGTVGAGVYGTVGEGERKTAGRRWWR